MSNRKVALVTGASRGAGAGIARGLGELGMTVYVTDREKAVMGKGNRRGRHSRCWLAVSLCCQLACCQDDGETRLGPHSIWIIFRRKLLYARARLWCAESRA